MSISEQETKIEEFEKWMLRINSVHMADKKRMHGAYLRVINPNLITTEQ